jgi:hypothetical protein
MDNYGSTYKFGNLARHNDEDAKTLKVTGLPIGSSIELYMNNDVNDDLGWTSVVDESHEKIVITEDGYRYLPVINAYIRCQYFGPGGAEPDRLPDGLRIRLS